MKRQVTSGLILVIVVATSLNMIADDRKANALLQSGITKETVEGDHKGAIAFYEQAVKEAGENRSIAAQAQLRIGALYKRQGDPRARSILTTIVNVYPEQKKTVAEAQALLNAMGGPKPAKGFNQHPVATGRSVEANAYITFDGRFMSWPDPETGGMVIRDMTAGRANQFLSNSWEASGAYVTNAIVSPDGRQVVYSWYPGQTADRRNAQLLVIANEPNARPTMLVENRSGEYCCFEPVGWSRDGRSVLIAVSISRPGLTWMLASVSLAERKVTPLHEFGWRLRPGRLSLSPDGQYVAYAALAAEPASPMGRAQRLPSSVPANQQIYVLPVDGSGPEVAVVQGQNINESPVWTHDGKHILFVSNRSTSWGVYSVQVENGKAIGSPSQVRANSLLGRISPIGMTKQDTYYYIPENPPGGFDVFLMDIDKATGRVRGQAKRLAEELVDWNLAPAWSPDGKRIAFKRLRPGTEDVIELVVYKGTALEAVHTYSGLDTSAPVWFHDNRSLLIRRNQTNGGLFRVDIESGEIQPIPMPQNLNLLSAVPSLDDRSLYLSVVNGNNRVVSIVAMDLASGRRKEIWSSGSPLASPPSVVLSPDGKSLAVSLWYEGWWSNRHLFRIAVDGSDSPTDLATSVSANMLAWSRDSRSIFFVSLGADESQLMRVATDGKSKPEPTGLILTKACGCGHAIALSDDGSKIVYSDDTRETSVWAVESVSTILKTARQIAPAGAVQ